MDSCRDASRLVRALASPPAAAIMEREENAEALKTITPSGLHAPPRPLAAAQSLCAGPPEASILLRLPAAKQPMRRLSGDQNGTVAPSVPVSGWATLESSFRTQSCTLPEGSVAVKARRRPSGETATVPNVVFSGG
jgi:hypothetical protein